MDNMSAMRIIDTVPAIKYLNLVSVQDIYSIEIRNYEYFHWSRLSFYGNDHSVSPTELLLSLQQSSLSWLPQFLVMPSNFLFAALLFTNLCSVTVNSEVYTKTWHAYNQDQVHTLSQDKNCEHFWNSSRTSRNLGNDTLNQARLWPGNVSLL